MKILVLKSSGNKYGSADYLPLSMDKAALRAMVQALHPVMQEKGIFLGTLTVCNVIAEGSSCAPIFLPKNTGNSTTSARIGRSCANKQRRNQSWQKY